jgi:hypothetical protein
MIKWISGLPDGLGARGRSPQTLPKKSGRLPQRANEGRTIVVEWVGASNNELWFSAVLIALVLLGTKLGAVGDALARFTQRRR